MRIRRAARRMGWIGILGLALAGCAGVAPRDATKPAVSTNTGVALGAEHPEATVVVFENFLCANCRKMQPVTDDLVLTYGDRVRFVFKPFVNAVLRDSYDPHRHDAHRAASAALAADRQGSFGAMSDKLFDNPYRFTDADLDRYASEIGLDVARFDRDRKSPEILARVDGFKTEANALGVTQTPTFFIGATRLEGPQTRQKLEKAILAALGLTGPAKTLDRPVPVEAGLSLGDLIYQPNAQMAPRTAKPKLKIGDPAPDFQLPTASGEKVRLSAFRGKKTVVLSFVPAAFTPVCSGQWPAYAALKHDLDAMDVQVLGITEDNVPSQYAWQKAMGDINFPVMSDFWPHGAVASKYGVLRPDTGTSERAVFIIDKKGIVRYIEVYGINQTPTVNDLLEALARTD